MLAFGLGPRACPAGSLSLLLAREMTNAALSAVELSPPPGRPVSAACTLRLIRHTEAATVAYHLSMIELSAET